MILLLKTMELLDVGMGWKKVLDFIDNLFILVEPDINQEEIDKMNDIKEAISGMIPENSKLKFQPLHPVV